MSRCDKTDLPTDMCAHCRGVDLPEREDSGDAIRARFSGHCNGCDREIEPGDWIRKVGYAYMHHDCANYETR